jgi:hypothetical protein
MVDAAVFQMILENLAILPRLLRPIVLYTVVLNVVIFTLRTRHVRISSLRTVACLLKARTVEPDKQLLLANGSETTFVSRQRLRKHVPAAMDMHAIIKILLETVFSTRSVQCGYKEDKWGNRVSFLRESVWKKGSWKGAAIQTELELVKLKNLHC